MSWRPPDWREIVRRRQSNPINRRPPTRFPYVDELMIDPRVIAALELAWLDTNADGDRVTAGCEQGGWIYMNLQTGQLTILRKHNELLPPERPGLNQRGAFNICLDNPPLVAGSVVVANFHTHPSIPFTGPSGDDFQLADHYGVPGIVRGRNGAVEFTGRFPFRCGDFRTANRWPGYPDIPVR